MKYTVRVDEHLRGRQDQAHRGELRRQGGDERLASGGRSTPITDLDCNGATAGSGLPLTLIPVGGSVTCTFHMNVTGNAGEVINDRITVTGKDDANRNVMDFAEATVTS